MKLPVFKAVATTAAFTLENWPALLKIVWAPYLVMFGLTIAFQNYVQSRVGEFMGGDIGYEQMMAANAQIGFFNLCLSTATGLLGLMLTAGILRFVIHGEKPKLPFYIRWSTEEWLLLGTVIATFAAVWLFTFLVSLALIAARGFIATTPTLVWIIPIVFLLAFLVLTVRLYLAFPAAIGRGEFGVGPAWSASSRQFFRLFAYLVIWAVLGLLLQIAALAIVVPDVLAAFYDAFTWGAEWISPLDLNLRIMESVDATAPFGILRIAGLWIFSLVSTIVGAIAMGVAWRMIDEKPARLKGAPVEGSASSVMGF
jgi:hypothetical protein